MFWLFQTLKFSVLPFQQIVDFVFFNIGVLYLGFSKRWNSVFLLFKSGIQCFCFSKPWNSGY